MLLAFFGMNFGDFSSKTRPRLYGRKMWRMFWWAGGRRAGVVAVVSRSRSGDLLPRFQHLDFLDRHERWDDGELFGRDNIPLAPLASVPFVSWQRAHAGGGGGFVCLVADRPAKVFAMWNGMSKTVAGLVGVYRRTGGLSLTDRRLGFGAGMLRSVQADK